MTCEDDEEERVEDTPYMIRVAVGNPVPLVFAAPFSK